MGKKRKRSSRRRRASPSPSKNYRTERYVEYIFTAEVAVLEAVALLPQLTDGEVLTALEKLIAQVRAHGLPRLQEQPTDTEGLIAWLIIQRWEDHFRRRGPLSKRDMAGCLQTVVESAETHVRRPGGRSYLKYLKKFMKRAGVSIQVIPASEVEGVEELLYDLERMSLAELGALWLREPERYEAADTFESQACELISQEQSGQVIEVCQALMEQTTDPSVHTMLCTLLGTAYRHLSQPEQAVTMFQAARSADPTNARALDEIAKTYYEMGQYERAIQMWQEALTDDPGSRVHYYPQMARAYRQTGDLAREEKAWRDLVQARERRGLWARLWRRSRSVTALTHLADCLRRQGKTDEWQEVVHQLERSWPHIKDSFDDWAYWVRHRLERDHMITSLLGALRDAERGMSEPAWSQVLQACVYDWQGQSRQSAPIWQSLGRQLCGTPRRWVLIHARDILGELLPKSSRLFDLIKEA